MKFVAATKKRHVDRSGDISTSLRGGKTDEAIQGSIIEFCRYPFGRRTLFQKCTLDYRYPLRGTVNVICRASLRFARNDV